MDVRASDAERERAVERLRAAAIEGRLTLEELADRSDAANRAVLRGGSCSPAAAYSARSVCAIAGYGRSWRAIWSSADTRHAVPTGTARPRAQES
jgi:Domain of unknown function (DUF1707)